MRIAGILASACYGAFFLLGCSSSDSGSVGAPSLRILEPMTDARVASMPLRIEVEYGGSLRAREVTGTLTNQSTMQQEDLSALLVAHSAGELAMERSQAVPGTYLLEVSGTDAAGQTVSDSVAFQVEAFVDFELIHGGTVVVPETPVQGQPVDVGFTVINRGTVDSPPTTVGGGFEPDPPVVPPPAPPPADIPPLRPGEVFSGLFPLLLLEANDPGTLILEVDPGDNTVESDESNNSDQLPMVPGIPSYRDLELRLKSFTQESLGQIRFVVEVVNRGTLAIDFPRLHYVVSDLTSGLAITGESGGDAGACDTAPGALNFLAHDDLGTLGVGQGIELEFTELWADHTQPSKIPGTTGNYELCIEVAASSSSDPLSWGPVLAEEDRLGDPSFANNSVRYPWDERNIGNYPANGGHTFYAAALTRNQAGRSADVDVVLEAADELPTFGHAALRLSWEAGQGRDAGQNAVGPWHPVILNTQHLNRFRFPLPIGIPHTSTFELTVEVRSGSDGSGPEIVSQAISVGVDYVDHSVESITTTPASDILYAPPSSDPIRVTVTVRNWSDEPVGGISVNARSAVGWGGVEDGTVHDLPLLSPSRVITIPGSSTATVDFAWTPSFSFCCPNSHFVHASSGGVGAESFLVPTNDNQKSREFTLLEAPVVIPLAMEPENLDFNPGQSYNVRARLWVDNLPAGQSETFELVIYDDLDGRTLVQQTETISSTANPAWFEYSAAFTPLRAGYHHLSVRVNSVERWRHTVNVSPILTVHDSSVHTVLLKRNSELLAFLTDPLESMVSGMSRTYLRKDSGNVPKSSRIVVANSEIFSIDDGTADPDNVHLMTIKANVDFAGVAQTVTFIAGFPRYAASVSVGIKEVSSCWETSDESACSQSDIQSVYLVRKPLWTAGSEGFLENLYYSALQTLFQEALEQLVTGLFGAAAGNVLGVVLEVGVTVHDALNCDDNGALQGPVRFTVPLRNGASNQYQIYVAVDTSVATSISPDVASPFHYSYIDFLDISPNCGGARRGVGVDIVDSSLRQLSD